MQEGLSTPYKEQMDTSTPHAYYPRPQLKRDSYLCLNGEWDFGISKTDEVCFDTKILVPFAPESALSTVKRLHEPSERLCYKRSFTLPDGFIKDRVLLHFGAVDQICTVTLNGCTLGSHKGGYLPFSFDVTDVIVDGENTVTVIVIDELSPSYPYGKQTRKRGGMWYTEVSGIWQTVWLESVPKKYIRGLKITPSLTGAVIEVDTDGENKKITLTETGEVFEFSEKSVEITPKEIKLWTPETPYLYHFTLEVEEDKIESYFALREIGTKRVNGVMRITLNGKPYLMNGLLDQGYFPDGIFIPPTLDGYKDDILSAKALGFNMLRKHIKIEPPIFYHLCDTLGMIVFQDMVNNSDYSFFRDTALPTIGLKRLPDKHLHKDKKSREIFIETMKNTLEYLYNSPSILYYTIFNEGWGQFLADEVYGIAKAIDNTRIFDATSGWFWQKKSDVISHHIYFKKLRAKPDGNLPVVISEFGGYSHRVNGHLFGSGNYGYRVFEDREEFENSVERLYTDEVLPLVKNCVSALVYTQISDVEDETNGFLTYDRRVCKVDKKRFSTLAKMLYDEYEKSTQENPK